jgi:hypothetical protein
MVFESFYNFENLTAGSVLIQDLSCSFSFEDEKLSSDGSIVLKPDCGLIIKSEIITDSIRFDTIQKNLTANLLKDIPIVLDEQKIDVQFWGYEYHSNKELDTGITTLTFIPKKEPFKLKGDKRTKISKGYFHLFDFKSVNGTSLEVIPPHNKHFKKGNEIAGITEMISDQWTVELQRIGKTDYNSYYPCLTHVGSFYRTDGSMFSGGQAQQFLKDLKLFLTFCHGSSCNPKMAVGFDDKGNKVWALGDGVGQTVKKSISWFDQLCPDQLIQLFPKFMQKLEDKRWKETLRTVICWYARSNSISERENETAIILTQVAMEKLAYEYVVNDKRMMLSNSFTSTSFRTSDRIRLLYANLGIPIDIPQQPATIQQAFVKHKITFEDSFHFLTDIRNNIVHAKLKKNNTFFSLNSEARRLGLWYLELAILKVCNFNGKYKNRLLDISANGKIEKMP